MAKAPLPLASTMNRTSVDAYLRDGCGRCAHYRTPACKVRAWTPALEALRAIAQASGLTETMKWGSPCYTLAGKNVLMIVAFKESCALQFFKGAALDDPDELLEAPGPNSQAVRMLKVRSLAEVKQHKKAAKRLIDLAIALERAGGEVATRAKAEPVPDELARRLAADPKLRRAFDALTPGRQRSHILHVSGAKQPATRERRVDACAEAILAGRGFNERV